MSKKKASKLSSRKRNALSCKGKATPSVSAKKSETKQTTPITPRTSSTVQPSTVSPPKSSRTEIPPSTSKKAGIGGPSRPSCDSSMERTLSKAEISLQEVDQKILEYEDMLKSMVSISNETPTKFCN